MELDVSFKAFSCPQICTSPCDLYTMTTTPSPSQEGFVDLDVPAAGKACQTWYRIFGPLPSASTLSALVCLHGGPGCASEYLLPLTDLSTGPAARPVVLYDQLGCGRSTHLPDKRSDAAFWTETLFQRELDAVVDALGLRAHGFDILGHSWGGMLGATFAASQPRGLRRLVISNSPASMALWIECTGRLRATLPADVQAALDEGERTGKVEEPAYLAAVAEFYCRFLCRERPYPAPELAASMRAIDDDPTVYLTMNGPSEFYVTGSLKTWSCVDRLKVIEAPTLLVNGRYDEAQDSCVAPYFEHIKRVRWVTLEDSSHFAFVEQRERYMEVVRGFLSQEVEG